jgi:hypothetical protein
LNGDTLVLMLLESVIRSAGQLMGVMLSERSSARNLAWLLSVSVSDSWREESNSDDHRFTPLF